MCFQIAQIHKEHSTSGFLLSNTDIYFRRKSTGHNYIPASQLPLATGGGFTHFRPGNKVMPCTAFLRKANTLWLYHHPDRSVTLLMDAVHFYDRKGR